MTATRLEDYLDHIIDAAAQVALYVAGMDSAVFQADKRTQQAVILNLVIVGEATARLLQHHEAFLRRHPDIPWQKMRGMRNRPAHGYFDINLELVWNTLQTDLPDLLERIIRLRTHIDDAG